MVTTLPLMEDVPSLLEPPTGIVAKAPSLSEAVEIRILPVPATTTSLKVRTILAVVLTSETPSVGDESVRVGAVVSYVQLNSVAAELLLPTPSVKVSAATLMVLAPSSLG